MRVAVAGATGNAGKEVLRALHAQGVEVIALARSPEKLQPQRAYLSEVRQVEVTDPASLIGQLDGVDAVISAVGKTYQKDKTPRQKVDVEANLNLIEEAVRAGVQRFTYVSVYLADPHSSVAMLRMKGEVERALENSGLAWTIVQPSGFFSDMWELFKMAQGGTFWALGSAEVAFNPVSLQDLGDFLAKHTLSNSSAGARLTAGGPDAFNSYELASLFERILQRKIKVRTLPFWLLHLGLTLVRPFSRNTWELGSFFVGAVEESLKRGEPRPILTQVGENSLEAYLKGRIEAERERSSP